MHLNHLKFILICLSFSLFADHSNDFLGQEQLLELLSSNDESILSVEENGEVYVNPCHLSITGQAVCLRTGAYGFLKIPALFSNNRGSYVALTAPTVYPIIKCKNCNKPFCVTYFNKGKCPSCGVQN